MLHLLQLLILIINSNIIVDSSNLFVHDPYDNFYNMHHGDKIELWLAQMQISSQQNMIQILHHGINNNYHLRLMNNSILQMQMESIIYKIFTYNNLCYSINNTTY